MAPEVIEQSGYDFKADVWSLGITAVELIHGEPPNAGKHPMKVLMEIPKMPAPRLEGTQYGKDFKDFVAKCLIKDPDQRPSAKELLKHKFIRSAGRTEALQELILRRQEWEAGLEKKETLKYYAETLRSIKMPVQEEDDDWVFDTVKAMPTVRHTQKRRKLTVTKIEDNGPNDDDREMTEETNTAQQQTPSSTMRRLPDPPLPPSSSSSSINRSTKKRISSGQQKQPLGVNMSFGNSPSTVRQFRRVSPTAIENERLNNDNLSAQSSLSPSKLRNAAPSSSSADSENMPPPPFPPPLPARNTARVSSSSRSNSNSHSNGTSTITTTTSFTDTPPRSSSSSSSSTKEATLGHALYTTSVGPTCQEILNNTASPQKREALSRLAEAFSDLEVVDPEGLYHVLVGTLDMMGRDEKLRGLLPATSGESTGTVGRTLSRDERQGHVLQKPAGGQKAGAATKLVLAQNNPHLKSHHRRRQSTQVPIQIQAYPTQLAGGGEETSSMRDSPRSAAAVKEVREEREEDRAIGALMPGGQGEGQGMEHVQVLGDVLFERWCEGLRGRWSGNAGVGG